ncbi:MAG: methylated-DNA--[protein]-cysteine S-methyltransferase [Firmicutes bacterium]|nr:methylated-DNA--[protein]-cysteine S-methyltransferase [Bacillota bacterium]
MLYALRFEQPGFDSLTIAQHQEGICFIGLGPAAGDKLAAWAKRYLPGSFLLDQNTPILEKARTQLLQYFAGERRAFELPLTFHGTPFQLRVWDLMTLIPYGKTVTYADLATALNNPGAVRAVGQACGANPIPIVVPCHRVLAKGSLGGYTGGLEYKKYLLELEGIGF